MHLMGTGGPMLAGDVGASNATAYGFLLHTMLYFSNFTDRSPNNTLQDYYHLPSGAALDPNQPKCYGVYGCFPTDFPWTTKERLLKMYPQSPETIRPKFPVFHRQRLVHPFMLNLDEPQNTRLAGIDPLGRLFVLAHGYIDSGDRPWLQDLVHGLIEADPDQRTSVLIVDWGGGSNPPYAQAVANTRLVGAIAAHVVHMVHSETGLPMDRMHMIGHSLGAHLSGYTGHTLQKEFNLRLGRITGLDPAEPLFMDTEPLVRLDPSDATFVDVVHTDAQVTRGGLGMWAPVGHVDFYPNGGNTNPGCDMSWGSTVRESQGYLFGSIQQFLSCNHLRSYQFLTESIRATIGQPMASRCPFMGITCSSWDDFKRGHCFRCNEDGNQCVRFGLDAYDSYRGLWSDRRITNVADPLRVYMMTGDSKPFCRVHYKLTVVMSDDEESLMHGGELGVLKLVVKSQAWAVEEAKRQRTERMRGVRGERTDEEWERLKLGVGHRGEENATETMRFSEEPQPLEPGQEYAAVMAGRDVGVPTHATLSWEYHTSVLNPLTWRLLSTPRIYVAYVVLESLEHGSQIRLCSMFGEAVTTLESKLFLAEYCEQSR